MIKEGSTVRLVYTGTLDDGTVFGYAKPEAPMEFQTGMDLTIDGFEREISQMEAGEKKTFTLGIYDAYGEYLDHLVEAVPVEYVPLKNVEVGMRVQMTGENGEKIPVTIKDITSKEIIFDMNHPLAGKDETINYINEVSSDVVVIFDGAFQNIVDGIAETKVSKVIVASPADSLPFLMKQLYELKVKRPTVDGTKFILWKQFIKEGKNIVVNTVKKNIYEMILNFLIF